MTLFKTDTKYTATYQLIEEALYRKNYGGDWKRNNLYPASIEICYCLIDIGSMEEIGVMLGGLKTKADNSSDARELESLRLAYRACLDVLDREDPQHHVNKLRADAAKYFGSKQKVFWYEEQTVAEREAKIIEARQ